MSESSTSSIENSIPVSATTTDRPYRPANLPPLVMGDQPLSFFEFWPTYIFYAPVSVCILFFSLRYGGLTLPTYSNPSFTAGGFCGESKAQILSMASTYIGDLISPFIKFNVSTDSSEQETQKATQEMERAGVFFPVVAKPDMGCRGAGVQPIYTKDHLTNYLKTFPMGADVILQNMVSCEGEAGVFYVREPGQQNGRILSLTLKYFPYVTGNGTSSLQDLIKNDPRAGQLPQIYLKRFSQQLNTVPKSGERVRLAFAGNHSKGTIFRNGNDNITPEMEKMFDTISKKIPNFYFGRYDIRFDDFERIQKGYPEFKIIEINGAGAEVTHIWDSRTSLMHAWRDVIAQYNLLWKIGAANKALGFKGLNIKGLWQAYRNEKSLTKVYPQTH